MCKYLTASRSFKGTTAKQILGNFPFLESFRQSDALFFHHLPFAGLCFCNALHPFSFIYPFIYYRDLHNSLHLSFYEKNVWLCYHGVTHIDFADGKRSWPESCAIVSIYMLINSYLQTIILQSCSSMARETAMAGGLDAFAACLAGKSLK